MCTFAKVNVADLEPVMEIFANARVFLNFSCHFVSCEWQSTGCATTPHAYTQYVLCVCVSVVRMNAIERAKLLHAARPSPFFFL